MPVRFHRKYRAGTAIHFRIETRDESQAARPLYSPSSTPQIRIWSPLGGIYLAYSNMTAVSVGNYKYTLQTVYTDPPGVYRIDYKIAGATINQFTVTEDVYELVSSDNVHSDTSHTDTAHSDTAHSDTHSDGAHSDVAHSDSHSDVAHTDVAHGDSHSDTAHTDTIVGKSHVDGGPHADSHSDSAHSDVAHTDTHSDVAHSDAVHADSHSDTAHSDVAHGDSG